MQDLYGRMMPANEDGGLILNSHDQSLRDDGMIPVLRFSYENDIFMP